MKRERGNNIFFLFPSSPFIHFHSSFTLLFAVLECRIGYVHVELDLFDGGDDVADGEDEGREQEAID